MDNTNNDNNEDLEKLLAEESIIQFNPTCVRKKSNISKSYSQYKFDSLDFSPKTLLNDIPSTSPKLQALLNNIEKLDKRDKEKDGVLYKHFIFSDLKSSSAGAKLLASAMIAKGFNLSYTAPLKNQPSNIQKKSNDSETTDDEEGSDEGFEGGENKENKPKAQKNYGKITLLSEDELRKNKNKNFYLLASTGVYDQPITVSLKKEMLKKFNQRPENIHGENVRFMIMDSGFKEGIDLFDIKYIHIFEPSILNSDRKQVIGRGTRTCGQKGLDFHPTYGWPLHVYVYDLEIPEQLRSSFMDTNTAIDLYLKSMNLDIRLFHFAHDLEQLSVIGSVDYELNKNVHSFSIPNEDNEENLPANSEFVYGGEDDDSENEGKHIGGAHKKFIIRKDLSPIIVPSNVVKPLKGKKKEKKGEPIIDLPNGILIRKPMDENMGHVEMRNYINDNFSHYAWDKVKMENKCGDKQNGGAGDVITYSPTQDFIRHYFTPESPLKGMLIWNSVGSGKSCTAIATATSTFEREGYTILWVTRTTLKSDIWKNMFEQVCNEDIRDKLINTDLKIPDEHSKRMKLVSKSWSIRPMSYKQFSNLVTKSNSLYASLVKKNGEDDPLRKTLLIIDEAHKLYGGADLSSIERPDMPALHKALMSSYQISGRDSVKLLLMTATPITKDPLELIQLLNLCKLPQNQLPTTFDEFSEKYLNEEGKFTEKGKDLYLDQIAGHISYLNREKDARQFSQPIVHNVLVPMVKDMKHLEKFDKKYVRQYLDSDISKLKQQIKEKSESIDADLADLDKNRFISFYNKCENLDDKEKKACEKIVRENITSLINEVKEHTSSITNEIKELREAVKNKNLFKKETIGKVRENIDDYAEEYKKFKNTLYYTIRNECGKTIKSVNELKTAMAEHPDIIKYDNAMVELNNRVIELTNGIKQSIENNKKRIKYLKSLLKEDLSELERNVIKLTIKDEQKNMAKVIKTQRKESTNSLNTINKKLRETKKLREKKFKSLRKTLKKRLNEEKKEEKAVKRAEKKTRKELRKQKGYEEELKHDLLKELKNKYSDKIDNDLTQLDNMLLKQEEDKIEKMREKAKIKEEKEKQKQQEKVEKEKLKLKAKLEKEQLRKTKKAEKEKEKQFRKTQKNKK
jgi:hypothetical protein